MDLVKLIQLLIILLSFAQESKISIISQKLDLSDITIGDKITYTLVVEHDKDTQLLNPKPIVMAPEHFETYGPDVKLLKSKTAQRGRIWKSIEYKITAYEPGEYNIPPITIKCLDANGREFSAISKTLGFRVRSVRPNGARTIKDIRGPENVPRNIAPYILIWVVLIAGLGVFAYFYFKKRKVFVTVEPETVILQRLPHEIALDQLREIELMDLVAKGEMKKYCTRISEVIRRYIEKRYGIAALELTTAKVLDALLKRKAPIFTNEKDLIDKIGDFLNACDSVKFAKYQPSADEAYNLLQQARKIVE